MEQRDQAPEQPEQPQQPAEDIGRAAAEASSLAGEYSAAPEYQEQPARRSPRRALVVGGVAVAVLALAGTAAGLAGHSHHPRTDTALNAAASSSAPGTTPPTTSEQSTPADISATGTTPSTPAPTTTPPTSPSPTPKSSPSKTPSSSTSSPQEANGENSDCENTSHDTAADESQKFSGMTHATQQAFLNAQKAAQATGLSFILNSGYRSATYQQRIFDCWVHELGSPQAARQYALPPSESAHVQGYAMDIAPPAAASWLQSTKGQYGLCRRYADETWHFEYQLRYKTQGCPTLLPHP